MRTLRTGNNHSETKQVAQLVTTDTRSDNRGKISEIFNRLRATNWILVIGLTKQMNGSIELDFDQGVAFKIKFND